VDWENTALGERVGSSAAELQLRYLMTCLAVGPRSTVIDRD
jgi:hypothetical protein